MRKLCAAIVLLAGLSCLGACESFQAYQPPPEPKPGTKEAEIEALQKATGLANGELAWETVHVSEIQRDAASVKWLATTRSVHMHCTADPDGSGAYCAP